MDPTQESPPGDDQICTGRPGQRQGSLADSASSPEPAPNELLTGILESIAVGICVWDPDLKLVTWNSAFRNLLEIPDHVLKPGAPLSEILDNSVRLLDDARSGKELEALARKLLAEKGSLEIDRVHADGNIMSVTYHAFSTGGWIAIYHDVTERRRDIKRLRDSERELKLQNMRFEAAVNNMRQGLCMFDAEKRLIICNDDYARLYKLPPELVVPGTTIEAIFAARLANGTHPASGPESYFRRRLAIVESGKDDIDEVELQDGRLIAIGQHPMLEGGWVATHVDVTEQRRNEARIRHLARHDPLTDLPNRMMFLEHMSIAQLRIKRGEHMAVLCIDLDHFKSVNDTLGHSAGDAVLVTVGDRLRESCREVDVVARLGGDEFAVLLGPLEKPEDAAVVAGHIIKSIGEPFRIHDHLALIGASIGIAVAPSDGVETDTLMKNADLALYRAKSEGRGAYHFFEPGMDASLQARRAIEMGLRVALAQGELELLFQPQLSLEESRICGMEALLRWNHPERGLVPLAEFMPIAEETGLIVQVGEWVIKEACAAATAWPADVRVAVNLSPVQFKSRYLVQQVVSALARAGLDPSRLELEVTELVLLADNNTTLRTLHQLRSLGVRISMDDFGTGYSSLSYLRSFPFDKIKINQSLVESPSSLAGSLAIVKAVIGLGHSLGMSTTVEGVETAAQLKVVREEGCTEVQGSLFSPPLAADAVMRLFARTRRAPAGIGESAKLSARKKAV